MPKQEWLWNRIFVDLASVLVSSWPLKKKPRGDKIDAEKRSKFDRFLKASWNAIFSAKSENIELAGNPLGQPSGMRGSPGEE